VSSVTIDKTPAGADEGILRDSSQVALKRLGISNFMARTINAASGKTECLESTAPGARSEAISTCFNAELGILATVVGKEKDFPDAYRILSSVRPGGSAVSSVQKIAAQ
jgi:hypothetical protein